MADEPVHMATSESLKFECGICLKEFSTSWCLQIHIKTHDEEKSFDCNECGKVLPNFNLLCDHLREHIFGADPVEDFESCSVCAKQYPASQMPMHKRSHIFKPGLTCKNCGKSFGSSKVLKLHERTHGKNTPFQCSSCGLKFSSRNAFMLHWNNNCSSQSGSISSKVLGNTGSSESPQKAVTKRRGKGNARLLKTGLCSRDIIKKGKYYKCNVCGKRFDFRFRAVMHYQVHQAEQTCLKKSPDSVRHVSTLCLSAKDSVTESLADKHNVEMDRHVKASDLTVEEGASFLCIVCNKAFESKQKASVHTLCHRKKRQGDPKHAGLKHFKEADGKCGLSVTRLHPIKENKLQQQNVKSKKRVKHKTKTRISQEDAVNYTCSECMKSFNSTQDLKSHQSVHIKEHAIALMRILDPDKDITLSSFNTKTLADAMQLVTRDVNMEENGSRDHSTNKTDSGSDPAKIYLEKSNKVSQRESLCEMPPYDVITCPVDGAASPDSQPLISNICKDSASDDIDAVGLAPNDISSYKTRKLSLNHKNLSDECELVGIDKQNKVTELSSKEHDQPNKKKCKRLVIVADDTSNCMTKSILPEEQISVIPLLDSELNLQEKTSSEKMDLCKSMVEDEKVTPIKEHFKPKLFSNLQGPKRTRLDVYDKIVLKHGKYHCALCSKMFNDQKKARNHVRNHVDAKKFRCDECGLALARKHAFELHKKMHDRRRSSGLPPLQKRYKAVQRFGVDLNLANEDCSPVTENTSPPGLAPDRQGMILVGRKCEDKDEEHVLSSASDGFPLLNFRRKRMDIHGNIAVEEGSSKCKICKREFTTYPKAYNHVRNHVQKKKFKCDECGFEMKSRNHYNLHKQGHELRRHKGIPQRNPVKSWSCDIQTVRDNRILDNGHFICKICRKMYTDLCGLDSHIRRHFKKFRCLQCEKIFDKKLDLEEHEVLHKLKAEEETQRLLEQFPGVQRNVVVVLERLEDAKFAENCDIWTFVSRPEPQIPATEMDSGGITKHLNQQASSLKPSTEKRPATESTSGGGSLKKYVKLREDFHCHVCNEVFKESNIFNVEEHIDNHFNIFDCHKCCLSFPTKCYLLQHIGKTDHGETQVRLSDGVLEERTMFLYNNVEFLGRSYLCKICGQNFADRQIAKDHVMSHFEKGVSQCTDPRLHFSRNNHANDGSRLKEHSDSKVTCKPVPKQATVFEHISKSGDDYLCNICQCLYTSREKVKKHIRNHLHGSRFKCSTCHQSFKYKRNLELHQRLHGQTGSELNVGSHSQSTDQRENRPKEETFPIGGNYDPDGSYNEFTSLTDGFIEEFVERKGECFCCTICERTFKSNSDVSVHLKTHASENKSTVSNFYLAAGETNKNSLQTSDVTKHDQGSKIVGEVQSSLPVQSLENNHLHIHSRDRCSSDDDTIYDFVTDTGINNDSQTSHSGDALLRTKCPGDTGKLTAKHKTVTAVSVDPIAGNCDGSPNNSDSRDLNVNHVALGRSLENKQSSICTEERSHDKLQPDIKCDHTPSRYNDRNIQEMVLVETTADGHTNKEGLVGSTVASGELLKSDKSTRTNTDQCDSILLKKPNAVQNEFSDSDNDDASQNASAKAIAAALAACENSVTGVTSSENGTEDTQHKSVVNYITAATDLQVRRMTETLSTSGVEDADDDSILEDFYDDDRDSDYRCESDSESGSDICADDTSGMKTCTASSTATVIQQNKREIKLGKKGEKQVASPSKHTPVHTGKTGKFEIKTESNSLQVSSSKDSTICGTETEGVQMDNGNSIDGSNDNENQQDAMLDCLTADETGHFHCNHCAKVFESADNIMKHIHSQHKIKKFLCKFCIAAFHTDKELQQHYDCNEHLEQRSTPREIVNGNCHKVGDMYRCKLCGKEFPGRRKCENHIRYHLISHKHICDVCGSSFRSQYLLSLHRHSHINFRPFPCKVCSKTYPRKAALRQHEKSHSEQERVELLGYLKCQTCGEICCSKKMFDKHMLNHKKSHACEVCDVSFETSTGLENHQYEETHYKCSQCGKVLKSEKSFRCHLRDHEDKEVYPCELCGKICQTRWALNSHQQLHKAKERNTCEICGMTSSNRSWLKNHMKAHKDGGNRCDKCKKFCRTATSLKIHEMMHLAVEATGETFSNSALLKTDKHSEYVCPICDNILTSYDQLRYHIRHHFTEKKYKCYVCSAAFHSSTYLKSHIKIHNNDLPFKCDQCPKKFPSKTLLILHVNQIHLKRYDKEVECDICHKVLKKGHLKTHKLIHEKKRDRNYPCDECELKFYTASQLKVHKQLHMAKYDFICETCGAQYKNKYQLRDHMLRHTGKKEFKCEECGKEFLLKAYLSTHMKNHMNERKFKCSECGKAFNHRHSLNDHMRIHTGEKPYRCKYCDRKFTDRSARGSHERTHKVSNS